MIVVYNIDLKFKKGLVQYDEESDITNKIAFSDHETEAERIKQHYEEINAQPEPILNKQNAELVEEEDGIQLHTITEIEE